ncbi:MAG: GNAT family N-acetyltransferase [Ktedonobacteraceae bacterium]
MQITDLHPDDERAIEQAARLLVEGFSPLAWPDMETALAEVRASFENDHISRVALDEQSNVLGWIGGVSEYDGNVWEMHPLVVDVRAQGQGIGRSLVQDFEKLVQARGCVTVMLGTDDEDQRTTLSGVNLFPNVYEHIAHIKNVERHPYEFYQKLGYMIVGVIPDANGLGKPDILMAKSMIR